jgi:hypothetical protein
MGVWVWALARFGAKALVSTLARVLVWAKVLVSALARVLRILPEKALMRIS